MRIHINKKIFISILFSILVILFLSVSSTQKDDLTFPVKMNNDQAIHSAIDVAKTNGLNIKDYKNLASFSLDSKSQTYYELEVGNTRQLNSLIQQEKGYIPAIWTVSSILESGNDKIDFYFTPSGKIYGFYHKIPENTPGASLEESAARNLAEKQASAHWNINFGEYSFADKSKKVQSNGRIDYIFNYKRNIKIGEAQDKVSLRVAGDKLTAVQHYLDIPETFSRKYEERRSSNDTIANAAMFSFYILLFVVGFFCFFYLSKRKLLAWKKPLFISIIIALLACLSALTSLKSELMNMDPSLFTPALFYIVTILSAIFIALFTAVFTFVAILVGEGLSRKAFPKHLQFWKMLSMKNIGSKPFFKRVLLGYVFVAAMLMYESIFYGIANHFPGWWQPSSMVVDPNIQTDWFAWLRSLADALNAGFMEEFGFRAIPISLGVLIGNRYNKRKLGLGIAFAFEVLMFSAAHANYPGFPAYARLLELLIVAFGFGLLFYYWGIIPGVIAHFTYDFILMTMPIASNPGKALVYQKFIIVLIIAFPLLLCLYARFRNKGWILTDESTYNEANQGELIEEIKNSTIDVEENILLENDITPAAPEILEIAAVPIKGKEVSKKFKVIFSIACSAIAFITLFAFFSISTVIPPLYTEKKEAEALAEQELEHHGLKFSNDWKVISTVIQEDFTDSSTALSSASSADILKREGKNTYKSLMGNYIIPLKWKVRFIRTTGNANERAEEYAVILADKDHIVSVEHTIPNNRKGEVLSKEKAEMVLYAAIEKKYGLKKKDTHEISANEIKLDARTDWSFTIEDRSISLKEYRPVIKAVVSSNEVLQLNKTLQLPEEKENKILKNMIKTALIGGLLLLPFIFSILAAAIKSIIAWTKKSIVKPIFIRAFVGILAFNVLYLFLDAPSMMIGFSTATPFKIQLITSYALSLLGKVILSFIEASILAHAKSFYKGSQKSNYINILLSISAGLLISSFGMLFSSRPAMSVDSSVYCSLGSYSKLFSEFAHTNAYYLEGLSVLLALILMMKSIKSRILSVILSIFIFLPLGATSLLGSFSTAMLYASLFTGITYILLYNFLYRHNVALAALTLGISRIVNYIKIIILNQYPGLNLSIALSILILLFLIIYTYKALAKST